VVFLAFTACQTQAKEISKDEKEIRAIVAESTQGYIERNLDKIMVQYNNKELMFFDLMPPMRDCCGAKRARQKLEDFFAGTEGPVVSDFRNMEVTADRNLAYTTADYHFEFTGKDGKKYVTDARITDVWKKINGKWSVVHEHCSVPAKVAPWMKD
jgi:ketosteroid isomerase-like protein